ncbi:MAG: aspartyl/asparaginyl beta-hydroxylase domain-containing protein, partial [Woeseiaceae bacterium]
VEKRPAWSHLAAQAVPVLREVLERHYERGGILLRAMAAKLLPHGTIEGHIDRHPSFACAHRIHVPLLTNPDVVFLVGGKQVTMDVGHGYEINNQLVHRVHNGGDKDRIHFIFDYVPPDLVAQLPGSEGS